MSKLLIISVWLFSFLRPFANAQGFYCKNNDNGEFSKSFLQYRVNSKSRDWRKYLGDRLIIGGFGAVCLTGFISLATGATTLDNTRLSPSSLTYKQQCELADFGFSGIGMLVIGGCLDISYMNSQEKHNRKYALIFTGNKIGILYKFI